MCVCVGGIENINREEGEEKEKLETQELPRKLPLVFSLPSEASSLLFAEGVRGLDLAVLPRDLGV